MRLRTFSLAALVLAFLPLAGSAHADILGSADTYAVLAQGTVTNADASTVIIGNLGVSPAAACTGFAAPCTSGSDVVTGTTFLGAAAAGAVADSFAAYGDLANTPGASNLTGGTLGVGGDATLGPGVYSFSSGALLNGTLTLAGGSNPDPLWIFQIGSTLTTGSGSSVVVTGTGAANAGIYFEVGTLATLGPNTEFQGNILAGSEVIFDPGAQDTCGRVFAETTAPSEVTFAGPSTTAPYNPNEVNIGTCASGSTSGYNSGVLMSLSSGGTGVGPGTTSTPAPEPGTFALLLCGLLPLGFMTLRKLRSRPLTNRAELL